MPHCPLCGEDQHLSYLDSAMPRRYLACGTCHLAFMHPADRLTSEQEREYYRTHENSIDDEGYVRFLNLLLEPLLTILRERQSTDIALIPAQDHKLNALDYGCGPGPTLSVLLEKAGIACDNYDPFFFPQQATPPYDVITATECFEHFHRPAEELSKLVSWLKPGGLMALMTSRWSTPEKFMHWHYNRDPTHVIFMHDKTIEFIEENLGLSCIYKDKKRIVIFQKRRNKI